MLTPIAPLALALYALLAAPPAAAPLRPVTPPAAIQPAQPPLLLVDPARTPRLTIAWPTKAGPPIRLSAEAEYTADADRQALGENIAGFVAVGGTRLGKGAGHPRGALVRVGFYKIDNAKPFFRDLPQGGTVEVRLSGVAFNQPVDPQPESIVQHVKYSLDDLASCGMPGSARDQFNTASATDTLNDRIIDTQDARMGVLADPASGASSSLTLEADGTVTLTATFTYAMLRNLQDPWQSDLPGTFLEPMHFHIEFESLPAGVAPLDFEALRAEHLERQKRTGADPALPDAEALSGRRPSGEGDQD